MTIEDILSLKHKSQDDVLLAARLDHMLSETRA